MQDYQKLRDRQTKRQRKRQTKRLSIKVWKLYKKSIRTNKEKRQKENKADKKFYKIEEI